MRIAVLILFLIISSLVASDDGVTVKARKSGEYVLVDGMNNNPFSVTVAYNANYTNLKSEKKLPILFVLKAYSKQEVLRLHIERKNFSFKAHYDWTLGSKDAKHNKKLYL